MQLSDLNRFNEIVIQIHNNPDADAVGSGFAIYRYFKKTGKNVRLIYSGNNIIKKSNMLILISELDIPLEYVTELNKPELLITVDCQYGQGNVACFEAENIAMIDHHNTGKLSDSMAEIRSNYASASTICYAMLQSAGYDINADIPMATALYYGLYMDSDHFSEIGHPLERDMIDFLKYDKGLILKLKHANFNMDELVTAGEAITSTKYLERFRLAIVEAAPCDPNILGVIGDFIIQVDTVDISVTYNKCSGGYKISVRSCTAEITANELADYITKEVGSGGGHLDKAGGFINLDSFQEKYPSCSPESYLIKKIGEYYGGYDVIRYNDKEKDYGKLQKYRKKPGIFGYIKSTDLFSSGTECKIRTLDGDVLVRSGEDIYIMLGKSGEVYPIQKEIFDGKYTPLDAPFTGEYEYRPTVINVTEGKHCEILPKARQCLSNTDSAILARPLERYTKVFTKWNYDGYMVGDKGDMLCYTFGNEEDVYLTECSIFDDLYEKDEI